MIPFGKATVSSISLSVSGGYAAKSSTFTATAVFDGTVSLWNWEQLYLGFASDSVVKINSDGSYYILADANGYITSFSASFSSSYNGGTNQTTLTVHYYVVLSWNCPNGATSPRVMIDVTGGGKLQTFSSTVHSSLYFPTATLTVSPNPCSQGASLSFHLGLYYVGTGVTPPDGNYNVKVLLSGLTIGTSTSLVSGGCTITGTAPGNAGTYTYTCTADHSSSGTFPSLTVGYTLTISTSTGGTTSPIPGSYLKNSGATQAVTGVNSTGYVFDHWLLDSSNLYYDNPHTVTMGASHTIQAFFSAVTPPPSDTTPPTFGTITANRTGAGLGVNLTCPVSDNVAVSSYKFSWNNTGVWVNQTAVLASGASVTATFSGTWESTIGDTVSVKVYANDSSNNWNVTGATNFLLTDPIPPTFSLIGINSTVAGSSAVFSALAADNVNVTGYIFQSNMTGATVNSTWTTFTTFYTTTSAWDNVTTTLPGVVGDIVQWQFLVNDSANNWAACGLQNTTLTAPASPSIAYIVFYVGGGGLLYVNGGLTGDNATLNCTIGSSLSLVGVANTGYVFAGFMWTGNNSLVSPTTYLVSDNDTMYVYFNAGIGRGGGGGGGGGSSSQAIIVTVLDSSVTVVQGGSATFTLSVSWTGGGTLTVLNLQGSGNFSSWFSVEGLPKSDSSGVLHLDVKCSVPSTALLTGYTVPVLVGVQTTSGGSLASGNVQVTVVSGTAQLSFLEKIMTIIFILISFILFVYYMFGKYFR